ncbi:MAG: LPS biosynthesis protein [Deltaproteobacteria bacterium]|nr:MAG: LPS biosynthesis protein [Deltaproteobacteria bacterium]
MERVKHLVCGAGVTGLSFAGHIESDDYLVLEANDEIGGYCRTVLQDGFVWDYSGHFFHFKNPEIEKELISRMGDQRILEVSKESRIRFGGAEVDFPFQKNIHQLPQSDFVDCLYELYFKDDTGEPANFQEMLYAKFGKGIAERFLIPYNEKLYACDLSRLDVDAMGRFFPYADLEDIIRNMKSADNVSYNATFTYPEGGAIQYVYALKSLVPDERVSLGERLVSIDLQKKVATTDRREIAFEYLVSSTPFDRLLTMTGIEHDPSIYSWNKVLVFNLGFDRKGPEDVHWMYYPSRDLSFYRVGFYDNIFGTDRMSLYVEVGRDKDAVIDAAEVDRMKAEVLRDLGRAGVIDGHELVSWHSVVLDPAYVHITKASMADVEKKRRILASRGVYSLGRYGSWTYCSIEDNILEARALADDLNVALRSKL